MQWLMILLVACLVLSALKFVVAALVLVLAITILWGVFTRPAEAFGLLIFSVVANVALSHTGAALAIVAFLGLLGVLRRPQPGPRANPSERQLLADRSNDDDASDNKP
jgi:hypothetical protein